MLSKTDTPCSCPKVRSCNCLRAQRPLPSIITATCMGIIQATWRNTRIGNARAFASTENEKEIELRSALRVAAYPNGDKATTISYAERWDHESALCTRQAAFGS
eukprot:XP_001709867.1 Hypothetical protein GL50803_32497 [Giardia lamblia ATCC 50803]